VLELPRQLIDSKNPRHATADCFQTFENAYNYCDFDTAFTVTVNHASNGTAAIEKFGSFLGNGTRLLEVNYTEGTSTVQIQGTYAAPEFGSCLNAVGILGLIGAITSSGLWKRFGGGRK